MAQIHSAIGQNFEELVFHGVLYRASNPFENPGLHKKDVESSEKLFATNWNLDK